MRKLFVRKPRAVLGVDLATDAVKIVELINDRGQIILSNYGIMPLSNEAMIGADYLSKVISHLLKFNSFKAKRAILAIPDAAVFRKTITMNGRLNPRQMHHLCRLEVDQSLPYDVERMTIDYYPLGPLSPSKSEFIEVLVVAAQRELVAARKEVVQQQGLSVQAVEVESYALARATQAIMGSTVDQVQLMVHLDVSHMHLLVLSAGHLVGQHEYPFGSQVLVDAAAHHYHISPLKASLLMQRRDRPRDFEQAVLLPFIEQLVGELHLILAKQVQSMRSIFIAGTIAPLPGLSEKISQKLGIACRIANPFIHLTQTIDLNAAQLVHDAPQLMIACGLALREVA